MNEVSQRFIDRFNFNAKVRQIVNKMRSIIFIVLVVLTHSSVAQQRGFKPVEKTLATELDSLYHELHALVIGNSSYDEEWPTLPGVDEDVKEVSIALEKIGFNVVFAQNLDKYQLDSAFTNFISSYGTNPESGLLFYFAGHGHTINTNYGEKLGYIVPIGAANPNKNAMEFQSNATEMAQMEIYAKRN